MTSLYLSVCIKLSTHLSMNYILQNSETIKKSMNGKLKEKFPIYILFDSYLNAALLSWGLE